METHTQPNKKTLKLSGPIAKAGKFWHSLGPGFITGAADDDPSGVTTYSQAGSQFGFNFLWMAPFSFPIMAAVQEMCARIGLVTGRGLAGNIRRHYSKKFLLVASFLLFLANVFNIGANLGAMAEVVRLLWPQANYFFLILLFVVVSLSLQIYTTYGTYAKYLKWLALVLLAYVATAFLIDLKAGEIVRALVLPSLDRSSETAVMACAILGTTISPYLFFWQTSQEVEEEILEGRTTLKQRQQDLTTREVKNMRLDVWAGMFFSNLVMFFIILVCGSVLNRNGLTEITSAAQAAAALKPLVGHFAYLFFALGIIGTGLLSVPVLAGSASYAISETVGWKTGLYRTLNQARAFYGVIILAMGLGLIMNFLGFNPIKALFYSAVLNGLVAPVILVPIVQISDNEKIMGKWVNKRAISFLGWLAVIFMSLVATATLLVLVIGRH